MFIGDFITDNARLYPDKTALIHKGKYFSYSQINELSVNFSLELSDKDIFEIVIEEATKCMLTYSEIAVLYDLYIGESIYNPEKDDLLAFADMLKKLSKEAVKGRAKVWLGITDTLISEGYDVMDLYASIPSLEFPWFLNSKGKLRNIQRKLHNITYKFDREQ